MVQPSAHEQYMLEMINRARLNPTAEGNMFGISDLNDGLPAGTITTDPKQPLAFNELLIDSSRSHSQWMLDTNTFSHTGVDGTSSHDRMEDVGYQFIGSAGSGENIGYKGTTGTFSVTAYTEYKHEDLFLSPGHRKNILKSNFREIGIATTEGIFTREVSNPNYDPVKSPDEPEYIDVDFNSLMVTQNFAYSNFDTFGVERFLTGVAYDDLITADDFYTVGEGLADINITATNTSNGNSYSTTTMTAGGYQMVLPSGTYDVIFSDNGQPLGNTEQVTTGSENIKLDLNTDNIVVPDLSGDDTIQGSGSNDTLYGEIGNDRLYGYNGEDYLNGGADNDSLYGHYGDDTLIGGSGTDRIIENGNANFTLTDIQLTGKGTDTLSQIEEAVIRGGTSDNLLDASGATQIKVTLDGGGRHDTLIGGANNDLLLGRGGNDLLKGGGRNDKLFSHDGNDTLIGGTGSDRVIQIGNVNFTLTDTQLTGRGTDALSQIEEAFIKGGTSNNLLDASDVTQLNVTLDGAAGDDTLVGGSNDDVLVGRDGHDLLNGEDGNDKLLGYDGDDTLIGGAGNNIAIGGTGSDIFALESNSGRIIVQDFDDNTDMFGLTSSLGFSDLNIVDGGANAIIRDLSNSNQVLAIVANFDASSLTSADFVSI